MKSKMRRMTINIPVDLIKDVEKYFPSQTKTDLIHRALKNAVNAQKDIAFFKKYAGKLKFANYVD